MKRKLKKMISAAMSAVMLISSVSFTYAEESSGLSYFDFEYANYDVNENDGELKVKIKRYGSSAESADVAFKAADFLSTYGKDYEILDEDGNVLEKVSGVKPDPSEFVYDESISGSGLYVMPDETVSGGALDVYEQTEEADPNEPLDPAEFGGSPLLSAQAQYLDLPKAKDEEEVTPNDLQKSVEEMYKYFGEAEGADGIVHFKAGEAEKEITVVVKDNDIAESDKMFMLAILGAEGEGVEMKANATTYVSIIDDEEHEEAFVSIDTKVITLTQDKPTAEVTVRRTSGLQYFTSVYVSTVNIDDCRGAYEEFVGKTVAFVPGETEKTVTVTAKEFNKNTKFGVKLEGYDDVRIGNSLATVYINEAPEDTEIHTPAESPVTAYSADEDNAAVEAYASGKYLGSSYTYKYVGWDWETGPGSSGYKGDYEGNTKYVTQTGKGNYCFYVTQNPVKTLGIKNFSLNAFVTGSGYGRFETDIDKTWEGSIDGVTMGNSSPAYYNLSPNQNYKELYLKIGVRNTSNGNPSSLFFSRSLGVNWARYDFSVVDSGQEAQRKLFDFTTGDVAATYFDGETSKTVNLNGLDIKTTSGDNVSGFYTNNGSQVVFTAPDSVTKYGYVLDKVYFYNQAQNKAVIKTADSNGNLTFTPNQAFAEELLGSGVITNAGIDNTIYVKPVYKLQYARVFFYRSDGFVNIDQQYDDAVRGTYSNNSWVRYTVPKYSVIRAQYVPAANQSPQGVRYSINVTGLYNGATYYKEGEQIYSTLPDRQKETVDMTDFTKAEYVADTDVAFRSSVKAQSLYIGYSPDLKDDMKEQVGGSLEGSVIYSDDGTDKPRHTDKDGTMTLSDVLMGSSYNFRAYPPHGYYTSWKDMTGDTNNDGVAFGDGDEPKTARNADSDGSYNNYRQLVGSLVNLNIEKDNTRWQYYFAPAIMSKTKNITGTVKRRKATVLQLSTTRKESDIKDLTPISGIFVNIEDNSAMTDENGKFSIPAEISVPWGAISAYFTADGIEYSEPAQISHPNDYVIPALPKFEVGLNSVKASYANSKNKIADGSSIIPVKDDNFTIQMTIEGDAVTRPADAKFSIYDIDGNFLREADSSLFTVTKETLNTTNSLKVSVTFNPKAAMNNNEELYVQFADNNGQWYNTLSTGYKFIGELTLDKFIFPLIGSSTLESGITSGVVEDIIGNPLGDMNVGEIGGGAIETVINDYTSPGAEQWKTANPGKPLDSKYQWQANTFNFGYKKDFSDEYKYDSEKAKEKAEKEKKAAEDAKKESEEKEKKGEKTEEKSPKEYEGFEIIEKDSEEMPKDSKSGYSTKSSFKWSVTPFASFRLTLTQRPATVNGKTEFKPYFEDLTFVVGARFGASTNNTISTPIGVDVIINASLDGTVAGVYHMWTDYKDEWQVDGATPYTSEDFGVFKKFGPDSAVRREAYIFIDPVISVTLGIDVKLASLYGNAKFTFDMDFQFTDEEDEAGDMVVNYYGDMKIDLKWWVEVIGITVYEKKYDDVKTVKLFSQGTDKHISFDTADAMIQAMAADEFALGSDEPIGNEPVSRAYLKNRGGWNTGGSEIRLFSSDTTTEKTLQNGSAGNNNVQLVKINGSEMLMLFIDDVPARNNINKRALYYSIGDGQNWSQPVIVNDDGTLDDYATLSDLGDGRIFVAWSSAEKAFEESTKLEDALKSLNIQAAFFDTNTKTFGDVETLTKTTTEDYTADNYPHAVYDKATDRLMLYYTKTEYDGLDTVDSISKAASVNAFLTYENGKWSNDGSEYTDEELSSNRMKQAAASKGMTLDEYKQYYRDNWYGQKFLDLRLSDNAELTRVAETAAMYYDGQAVFAWITDWDNDLSTLYDRDVFVQVYDFESKEFKHIIRVTDYVKTEDDTAKVGTSGCFNPVFGRSAYDSYLFFGSMNEGDEEGRINYVNLDELTTDKLTKITDGGVNYYLPNNNVISKVINAKNVMDYDVSVDSHGHIYLFYTDAVNDSLQIMAAMLDDSGAAEIDDARDSRWSEPIRLTDVDENIYYTGLGAAIINDIVYIGAGKANYDDEADKSLVMLRHTPTADVLIDDVTVGKEHFKAGDHVEVTAILRNRDMLPDTKGVNVVYTVNGKKVDEIFVDRTIPGGFSLDLKTQVEIPENPADITFGAFIDDGTGVETTVENGANVVVDEQQFEIVDSGEYIYKATITNDGGKASEPFAIKATYGETDVETLDVPALESGEVRFIEMPIEIDENEFGAERNAATMSIAAVYNDENIAEKTVYVNNPYYWDVADTIAKVTDVKFDDVYTIQKGGNLEIQPVISGVDAETLKVCWIGSSDSVPVEIDAANIVYGDVVGQATITGYLVPYADEFDFDKDGNAAIADWRDRLPESSIVTVTALVNVVDETESTTEITTEATTENASETTTGETRRSSGGGGSSSSSASRTTTATEAEADTEETTANTADNGTVDVTEENTEATTARFIDIAGHWAEDVIEKAASEGIVNGYEDNSFRPNNSITRAEFVAMLYNSGLASTEYPEMLREFADVDYSEWYAKYLMWAVGNGIINGYDDNTFRGNNVITRQEMAVVVSKFIAFADKDLESYADITFTDEANIAEWAKPYVDDISKKAVVKGDNYGNFNPSKDLTRAETAVIITNIKDN